MNITTATRKCKQHLINEGIDLANAPITQISDAVLDWVYDQRGLTDEDREQLIAIIPLAIA
jgi:hypothetical protein